MAEAVGRRSQLGLVALHEAAHAIAALCEPDTALRSVVVNEDGTGRVCFKCQPGADPRRLALVLCAGVAAECRASGGMVLNPARSFNDLRKAKAALAGLDHPDAAFRCALRDADTFVAEFWPDIELLASRLRPGRTMSGVEVAALLLREG